MPELRLTYSEALNRVLQDAVSIRAAQIFVVVPTEAVETYLVDEIFKRVDRRAASWRAERHTLTILSTGAAIRFVSARQGSDQLRGPQAHLSWAFDLERAMDNGVVSSAEHRRFMQGLDFMTRLGDTPDILISTDRD